MFKFIRYISYYWMLLVIICSINLLPAYSQYGEFEQYVNASGWSGNVAFNVPQSSTALPLIIALHPAQTPETAMRQMMNGAANQINAILVCPSGPDGDGSAIMPLIAWCKTNYNVDEKKVFLTGYSAGSWPTFSVGFPNYQTFRGLIGIAGAYTQGMTQEAVNALGIGLICGTSDPYYSELTNFETQIINMGGYIKFHKKSGVDHTGQYFWSNEFTDDWVDLYNFCLNIVFRPNKILLTDPSDGQENVATTYTLLWELDPNATSYEIEISDDSGLVESKTRNINSYIIKNLKPGKTYYWKVKGINSSGEGAWSNEWRFVTKPIPPSTQVALLVPENGTKDLNTSIYFRWEEIEGASEYHIQVLTENDSVFKEYKSVMPEGEEYVEQRIYNFGKNKTYKWHVKAKNSAGEGPWSDIWTFSTIPEKPTEKVELSFPPNDQNDVSTLTTLKWKVIPNATNYYLVLRKFNSTEITISDSTIFPPVEGDEINYVIKNELEGLTKYQWRVCGKNAGGNGPWTDYNFFITWDPTGVEEMLSNDILIYPNPANQLLTIEIDSEFCHDVFIELYDVLGQKVKSISTNGKNRILVDISDLVVGNYFVNIDYKGGKTNKILFVVP